MKTKLSITIERNAVCLSNVVDVVAKHNEGSINYSLERFSRFLKEMTEDLIGMPKVTSLVEGSRLQVFEEGILICTIAEVTYYDIDNVVLQRQVI